MDYIFLDRKNDYDLIGIVEENKLVEFYMEDNVNPYKIGNIFRGRVKKISKALDALFIELGDNTDGFLLNKDIYYRESLNENDNILVQIIKESYENKAAKLTNKITLSGEYIILTPDSDKISISKKIDSRYCHSLREIGKNIIEDEIGFIIRTNAKNANEEDIVMEYNRLLNIYRKILLVENFLPSPKFIYEDKNLFNKLILKYPNYNIIVNNKDIYNELKDNNDSISLDTQFDFRYNIELYNDLLSGLKRKIELNNGSYIFIDKTEALTVIDVNSGSFTNSIDINDMIYKVNREACKVIIREIRLRNITGIIIIDFIDFRDKNSEKQFLELFNNELKKDINPAKIISMTKLGLLELTREKNRDSDIERYKKIILDNN